MSSAFEVPTVPQAQLPCALGYENSQGGYCSKADNGSSKRKKQPVKDYEEEVVGDEHTDSEHEREEQVRNE